VPPKSTVCFKTGLYQDSGYPVIKLHAKNTGEKMGLGCRIPRAVKLFFETTEDTKQGGLARSGVEGDFLE